MSLKFQKYVRDAESFIKEVAVELDDPKDLARAERVLRSVLRTLRHRLTPVESLQLIAQLPMLIKAIYVDGWQISNKYRKLRHLEDFIQMVRAEEVQLGFPHYETDEAVEFSIRAVFSVIKSHVSQGEIEDVLAVLPKELRPLLADA